MKIPVYQWKIKQFDINLANFILSVVAFQTHPNKKFVVFFEKKYTGNELYTTLIQGLIIFDIFQSYNHKM